MKTIDNNMKNKNSSWNYEPIFWFYKDRELQIYFLQLRITCTKN